MLVGVLATCVAGYFAISDKGAYYTRTEIVFLAPTSSLYPNALATQSEDIIDTAGVVAKKVTGVTSDPKYASPDVTLVGVGVRDGWSLTLPDTGGQWASDFGSQRLILDIVAPDRETVRLRQVSLLHRVESELAGIQRDAHVKAVNDITITAVPQSTVIYHVGGNKPRALGMTMLLGLGITATAVVIVEGRRRRRTISRQEERR